MDSDRDFGKIEIIVENTEQIFSVEQYEKIMRTSQRNFPNVTRMKGRLFLVKELPTVLGLKNNGKNTDGERVSFRDGIRWIKVTEFGKYSYKESFSDTDEWKTVELQRQETTSDISDPIPRSVHRSGIAEKKIADIRKQLPFIPLTFRTFYTNLVSNEVESDVTDQEEDDDDMFTGKPTLLASIVLTFLKL